MAPHADDIMPVSGSLNGFGTHSPSASSGSLFTVDSPNVVYTDDAIKTKYTYHIATVTSTPDYKYVAIPRTLTYHFKVDRKVPKVGVMLVGWGGNNGSTVTAGIIANRRGLVWETREGPRAANYYGSMMMGSTVKLGTDLKTGKEINVPFHEMLPIIHPNDLVIGGWDISSMPLAQAIDRACVLEPTLKDLVREEMAEMKPLPSIYYPDFIAANQEARADNLISGSKASWDHVEHLRKDIR
jgi:myo-inositol-1-phosphate synthase